jgi:hypothetical protein
MKSHIVVRRTAGFGCELLHRASPWDRQNHRSAQNGSADCRTSVQEPACTGREVI